MAIVMQSTETEIYAQCERSMARAFQQVIPTSPARIDVEIGGDLYCILSSSFKIVTTGLSNLNLGSFYR
jgi:hypothetical protein